MAGTTLSLGPEVEQLRTFDVLASIDLLKFDLQMYGFVQFETMQRVMDEELTLMAEGIDRPLFTEFTLRQRDGELLYFSESEWRPYVSTLVTGLQTAEREAAEDPRKTFLAEMAVRDLEMGYHMQALQPGERMVWDSPFPEAACQSYGAKFMGSLGFQPARRMGFVYQAEKNADGSVTLRSQSVDNSSSTAFAAVRQAAARDPGLDIESLRMVYDYVLEQELGTEVYAGRVVARNGEEENVWATLQRHQDLADRYLDLLIALAHSTAPRPVLEAEKKRLTYGVWALLKKRLDGDALPLPERWHAPGGTHLDSQIQQAYAEAAARADVLFGCGGAIEAAILETEGKDVFDLIFGPSRPRSDEDSQIPNRIRCIECRKESPKATVVLKDSWRCPHCKYEIDVCTGAVLHAAEGAAVGSAAAIAQLLESFRLVAAEEV